MKSRAQRLSASSEFTQDVGAFISADRTCSTPFGIIGIHTKTTVSKIPPFGTCSTPFGIIGIHTHAKGTAHEGSDLECSTPFGIIGIHTDLPLAAIFLLLCAQRLSASSEFTQAGHRRAAHQGLVLNAFRHHRNSHKFCRPICASYY